MSTLNHQPLTALVTGATSGLGKEIAVRLARDGMQVVDVGRDAAHGAAVVEQIQLKTSGPPFTHKTRRKPHSCR